MAETAFKDEMFSGSRSLAASDDGGAAARVLGAVRDLGLERNTWELDQYGYTVLSPAQTAPAGFAAKLREAILREAETINGVRPDLTAGASHRESLTPLGRSQYLPEVLYSDPIFEQAMMMPAPLALVTYLVGESCEMSAMNGVIKGPGPEILPFHVDTPQPSPLSAYSHVANATWILSDYNINNGPTVFVPGSHKWCRHPVGDETIGLAQGTPLEAPAGSLVVWHGNTWHGALPRTAPGLRISLITYFARFYLKKSITRVAYPDRITQAMLDRNPERFATLTGMKDLSIPEEFYCRNSLFA
jgi:hypothetical protein